MGREWHTYQSLSYVRTDTLHLDQHMAGAFIIWFIQRSQYHYFPPSITFRNTVKCKVFHSDLKQSMSRENLLFMMLGHVLSQSILSPVRKKFSFETHKALHGGWICAFLMHVLTWKFFHRVRKNDWHQWYALPLCVSSNEPLLLQVHKCCRKIFWSSCSCSSQILSFHPIHQNPHYPCNLWQQWFFQSL